MRFFTLSILALFVTGNFCSRGICLDNQESSNVSKLSPDGVCTHELSPLSSSSLPSIPEEVSVLDLIMIYKELICAQQKESELKDKIIADLCQQLAEISGQLEEVKLANQHVLSFMESNPYHDGLVPSSDSGSENGVVDGDDAVVTDGADCVVEDVKEPLESIVKAEKLTCQKEKYSHNRFVIESSNEEEVEDKQEEDDGEEQEEQEKTNKKSKKKKKGKKKPAKMDVYDGEVECIIC